MRLDGVVERRLLVNYRVDPDVLRGLLPSAFRPQVVGGWGVAGICLIRMGSLRPHGLPAWMGVRSENAAHRVAVEWDGGSGVYIPRRDTGSRLNASVGGRLYPVEQHLARFDVHETADEVRIAFESRDGAVAASVHVRRNDTWAGGELFADVAEASAFFERGSHSYSARRGSGAHFDGLGLETDAWHVEPVEVVEAASSWFDDAARFPPGSAVLDGALLMRNVPVGWRPLPAMHSPLSTGRA